MENRFRCDCPITSALDVVGDKWTLVLVKQMLLEGKRTFKDFAESEEAIATNILSSRLKMLEEFRVIQKRKLPGNQKTNIYTLTDKGLGLTPLIVELVLWSDGNLREFHPKITPTSEPIVEDKEGAIRLFIDNYRESNRLDEQS